MKKYIYQILFSALCFVVLASCDKDKDSEGLTYVENFPVITDADGNKLATVNLALGESFTPSYSATMGGQDITSKVSVSILDLISGEEVEKITTETPGMYEIHYSAETETGLGTWAETQSVYVYNPDITLNIAGEYGVNASEAFAKDSGGRFEPKEDTEKYVSFGEFFEFFETTCPISVTITQLVPGFYKISDAMFGWYTSVRYANEYGTEVDAPGYISLNPDNTISLVSSKTYWNDSVEDFKASYDPDTKSITFEYTYSPGKVYAKGVARLAE